METPATPPLPETPFVNEVRLNWKNWLIAFALILIVFFATPRIWKRIETFQTGSDYRIPYSLSKDYWLYERRLKRLSPTDIVVVGDSVIWGEYVRSDGTLSHFLSDESSQPGKFVNAGVNGLFPLAFEGLVRDYSDPVRHRKVILHCRSRAAVFSTHSVLQGRLESSFLRSR